MSIHIGARPGEIASTVLLPGDPLRAEYVSQTYFTDAVCHSKVRGMLGFTGAWHGKRVSVQGTGMGLPSISIYAHELMVDYGARRLIRIGTCGALREDMALGDLVLAQAACTDSAVNRLRFGGCDFAPVASFDLLSRAFARAQETGVRALVGSVVTSDTFYRDDPDFWKLWARYGIVAAEMETAALYTLAAGHGVEALSILTVSDNIVTHQSATTEQRQKGYTAMMELALAIGTSG